MLPIIRDEALSRLEAFLPHVGGDYAKRRNYDYGAGAHDHVSRLSPALRRRTITEDEVIKKTLDAHSFARAEKFIQEVFWRTYWKGWLEMRPSLWADYQAVIKAGFAPTKGLEEALEGRTGIACFDAWHKELCETNYLHNHARMWFASIWIHTLGLPWQAGADLFMRHLADGCPASNTLGWRWVAGLQTRGKAYGARADNIAQFTNGRFEPYGELQEDVAAIDGPENPPAMALRAPRAATGDKPLLVLTPEDCDAVSLPLHAKPVGVVSLPKSLLASNRAKAVLAADEAAMADGLARAQAHFGIEAYSGLSVGGLSVNNWQADLKDLMASRGADHIVMAFQPTGAWHDCLKDCDLPIAEILRPYDALCWPHAKKGFFPFKEKIPQFLSAL